MAEIVWGQFEYDRSQELLRSVFSAQTIQLGSERADRCLFNYRDDEVEVAIVVQRRPWGWHVDFSDMPAVKQNYGLWRRLAFGLPDFLSFWFSGGRAEFETGRLHQVTLQGGWQNGRWTASARITADAGGHPHDPSSSLNPALPKNALKLFPANGTPSVWRFVDARDVALEVKLVTVSGRELPLLNRTLPLDKQLERAPRFIREDTGAVIFHRYVEVNFHRGEDYDPRPYYGYANERVAITFDANSFSGVWNYADPILISEEVHVEDFFDDVRVMSKDTVRATPSLRLREELFFALFDIFAARQEAAAHLPTIRERDPEEFAYFREKFPGADRHWNGIKFAEHLDTLHGLPMCSPLGLARTWFSTVSPSPAARSTPGRTLVDWLLGVSRGRRS